MNLLARLKRRFPDTLFARIAFVLLLNLVLVQGVSFFLISLEARRMPTEESYLPERVAAGLQVLNSVAPEDRERFARAISGFGFQIRYLPGGTDPPPIVDDDPLADRIQQRLTPDSDTKPIKLYRVPTNAAEEGGRMAARFAVPLNDGSWMEFRSRRGPPPIRWYPIVSLIAAICLVVSVLSLIFARGFSRRLAEFASSADAFGRSMDSPPLDEAGPREIRLATHAFNRMQERLRRFVNDRTQMLAAISHDLRTPLTRLRLRAEFVEDEDQRIRMQCEIAEMEAMLAETMAFARDDASGEKRRIEDLDGLLVDLTSLMREAGQQVHYASVCAVSLEFSPIAMRRAFGNLLENAVNYGGSAEVGLSRSGQSAIVTIADHGLGIPEEMVEQVFQPFFRLEHSRNRDTGGVGLGLSVARTIIRGHGGDITLTNRPEGGLLATVTLPI